MSVVVLAGASGGIGTVFADALRARGDQVRQLVRRPTRSAEQVRWDPDAGELPDGIWADVAAVVNLGGVGVGDKRWTPQYKQLITSSRVTGTGLIARSLAEHHAAGGTPIRFLQASAVGYYGDQGEQELTEAAGAGESFLAHVCQAWEDAADPARQAGGPVVHLRTGIVLDRGTGALGRLLPLLKSGLAGPLGSGRQWWPWITINDQVRAMIHLLDSSLTGPVNITAPQPERNKDLTRALARQLGRPSFVPAPAFALRVALGEFSGELLGSQRVLPAALLEDGFTFEAPDIETAATELLAD